MTSVTETSLCQVQEVALEEKNGLAVIDAPGPVNGGVDYHSEWPQDEEKGLKEEDDDPWAATLPELREGEKWANLSSAKRARFIVLIIVKVILLSGFLYMFICSLDFLSTAFRLLGGVAAGEVLNDHFLLSNPVCGLMIGVLVTVLVQSSSTSTSIVVAMVSAEIIGVRQSIPIVMGANIGTSVTNTIVALGQAKERNEFRRAFGGATVHDMFNWLTVFIFLPIEVASHYLEALTNAILGGLDLQEQDVDFEILKAITGPFTKLIIQIDKKVITDVAQGIVNASDVRLLKVCDPDDTECSYNHLFAHTTMTDTEVGLIMLAVSIIILFVCLFAIVKLLHSMLRGGIAVLIKKFINADFPGHLSFLTGYLAILIGAVLTFVVQSSSIFTSAITPLVGIGVITMERMYPLTLGANIGTTATGILAALASSGGSLRNALQISLCHLFFNISGIIIWYPIPFMRKVPIFLAKTLGNTTASYRWFAIFYLLLLFFVAPAIVFGLSIAGIVPLLAVGIPILVFLILIVVINILQRKFPRILPKFLRSWEFLPKPLHSLEPLDRLLSCSCIKKNLARRKKAQDTTELNKEQHKATPVDNPAFDAV
ncbi:LOW QUALITY PROTEIN: sodium-dependent phosphate transport protein 2B-like [Acanthaster planci]|uniref:LOW QUALITY PROTEIN: sodium-dependent phosphate transport protein 2B-like n=1 Tax=Acanthaster planci TaxID=133434 RepID=A0A8B7ZGF2_ACAPL|nr:LOW QUALITY PROTEIN: sodium-dependent phosphate transport protein 2B-like [Acanthaster planci]